MRRFLNTQPSALKGKNAPEVLPGYRSYPGMLDYPVGPLGFGFTQKIAVGTVCNATYLYQECITHQSIMSVMFVFNTSSAGSRLDCPLIRRLLFP